MRFAAFLLVLWAWALPALAKDTLYIEVQAQTTTTTAMLAKLEAVLGQGAVGVAGVVGCLAPCKPKRRAYLARILRSSKAGTLVFTGPKGLEMRRALPWPEHTFTGIDRAGRLDALVVFLSSMLLEAQFYEPPPPRKPKPPKPTKTSSVAKAPRPPVVATATTATIATPAPKVLKPKKETFIFVDAGGGLRIRSPDLLSAQLGLGVSLGWVRLALAFQWPEIWSLQGRPINVAGAGLSLAYAPRLLRLQALSLFAYLGPALEWLTVQRADVPGAKRNIVFDVGVTLGGVVRYDVWDGLWDGRGTGLGFGLAAGFLWFPTGRSIEIPDGPSEALNRLGGTFSAQIYWRR